MNYQLENEFNQASEKAKSYERKVKFQIKILKANNFDCIQPSFEFWVNDEFSNFNDILDSKRELEENKIEYIISGSNRQIKTYMNLLRYHERKYNIKLYVDKTNKEEKNINKNYVNDHIYAARILDEEILTQIRNKLPEQPWIKGIHKTVATELNVPNKLVSIAIQQLISKGVFKNQVDGKIIDEKLTSENTV